MSSLTNESDDSMISNGGPKKLRKKKDKDKEKTKDSTTGKENDDNNDKEIPSKNINKKKLNKIIMEDSEEEDISVKKDSAISNGKDTNMSENNTSSNNDSTYEKNNPFKVPLMERLKKRNAKINEMPEFQITGFGKKARRDFDDLSDIEFDFNDKDKFF